MQAQDRERVEGSQGLEEELRFFLPGLSARTVAAEQRLEATIDEAARELEQIDHEDALYRDLYAHTHGGQRAGPHTSRPSLSDAGSMDSERDSGRR